MDLALIEAHLAVAEEHTARELLQNFEQSQAMHLADRDRLREELEEAL